MICRRVLLVFVLLFYRWHVLCSCLTCSFPPSPSSSQRANCDSCQLLRPCSVRHCAGSSLQWLSAREHERGSGMRPQHLISPSSFGLPANSLQPLSAPLSICLVSSGSRLLFRRQNPPFTPYIEAPRSSIREWIVGTAPSNITGPCLCATPLI